MITSKELQKINKIKGEIRGVSFKNDFDFVEKKEGKEQMKKLLKRMKELGCENEDVHQGNIKVFSWYPLRCHVLFFVILNKEMGWTKNDIFQIGHHGSKVSLLFKVFPKSMFDLSKFFHQAGNYWKKHFSVGKMELKEFDLEKKYVIFNLKKFNIHPLECYTFKGYLVGLMEIMGNKKNVKIRETKCVHKGNKFHQFKLTWEE